MNLPTQPADSMFFPCSKNEGDDALFMQVSIQSDKDNGNGIRTQVSTFECITCGEEKKVTQTYKPT